MPEIKHKSTFFKLHRFKAPENTWFISIINKSQSLRENKSAPGTDSHSRAGHTHSMSARVGDKGKSGHSK